MPLPDVPQQRKPEPAIGRATVPVSATREIRKKKPASPPPPITPPASPHEPFEPMLAGMEEVGTGLFSCGDHAFAEFVGVDEEGE